MEFKEKKKLKGDIKFNVSLNEEQKLAKGIIINSKITVVKGSAGSGKSLMAAQVALDLLFTKQIEKIIITRPTVTAGEEIGFMPGNIDAKLAPYTASVFDALFRLYSKEKIESCVQEGTIEVLPLAFMRGRNFTNCVVIVDEGQNITDKQMRLLLGRLCVGSKIVICGDQSQIDLRDAKQSGFNFICKNLVGIEGFSLVTLKTNHRDPIVEQIIDVYNKFD